MAATSTALSDVIVPQVFSDYVVQLTQEKSAFVQSGIATTDPVIQARCNQGGKTVTLPFWNDLEGTPTPITDQLGDALAPQKLEGDKDIAVKLIRGKSWGSVDIVTIMAGSDPLAALANRVAAFWARQEQAALIKTLTGVFGDALASTHVLDVGNVDLADGEGLTADVILDAKQLLGDAADNLSAIVMHSMKYTALQKANLIQYLPTTQVETRIPTYLGYTVIVDDGCPIGKCWDVSTNTDDGVTEGQIPRDPEHNVYTSYLFAKGAIAVGNVNVPYPIETYRNALASADNLISRKGWISHLRGVRWIGTGENPVNADLEDSTKWEIAYAPRAIRCVQINTL